MVWRLSESEMRTIMLKVFLNLTKDLTIVLPPLKQRTLNKYIEYVVGNCNRSFHLENSYVSVDFAMGCGCKIGRPTSNKMITVYYNKPNYVFQRFTVSDLKSAVIDHLNYKSNIGNSEQLSLF